MNKKDYHKKQLKQLEKYCKARRTELERKRLWERLEELKRLHGYIKIILTNYEELE